MVWIWSFNSNAYEYECDFALEGHTEDIKFVLWIDNSTVVSTSYDNTVRIWSRNDDEFEQ
jgi:WD40 repeat protein